MKTIMKLITKEELISQLREIEKRGWIPVPKNRRKNDGAVGNLLEDLLGIPENNLPIPNAAEWELKAQREETTSLLTLCHMEPSPRAAKLVTNMLLPYYGWPHKKAGKSYPKDEMSFRATLNSKAFSDRGFIVKVNRAEERVEIHFDSAKCNKDKHKDWFHSVETKLGLGDFPTLPYWGFNDLYTKIGSKLTNCFFVVAESKKEDQQTYFHYHKALMLKSIDKENFIKTIEQGEVFIDFDARTGHNHGTKFRIQPKNLPLLYKEAIPVL